MFEHIPSREAEVGGLTVRRALPRRARRTVGAWCFLDHFGPTAPDGPDMGIGPHPHMGLQTVTWLVEGELLHRDGLGSEQRIRPGEVNLMTAGNGIAHAEESPTTRAPQHGAQLWIALPEATRHGAAEFQHLADLPRVELGSVQATVLLGAMGDARSPARIDTPLVGIALEGTGDTESSIPLDPAFEYGVVVLRGATKVGADEARPGELIYLGAGRDELGVQLTRDAHVLLLGGEPFGDSLLMWWNFVARTRAEVDAARQDWAAGSDRFGTVASTLDRIPAPAS